MALITKAEVLLTRRCNITCGTCAVISPAMDLDGHPRSMQHGEMSLDEWCNAFDIVYDKLGGTFIALYGGEPLVLPDETLCGIFKHLASKRSPIRNFTVISNGINLTKMRARLFVESGLDSWTSSVDTAEAVALVGDKWMNAKTSAGVRALQMMKNEFQLRDTCGIVTVTAKNLDQIIPTIQWLTDNGHWAGIDFLHYQRGDGEYTFSTSKFEMEKLGLLLEEKHLRKLREIADWIIYNHKNLMVFPTVRVLEMWKDPATVMRLDWKCQPGHSITIDSNGDIGLCDDRMPNKYGSRRQSLVQLATGKHSWHITDFDTTQERLDVKWGRFLRWYQSDLDHCRGCFWSTHVMAVDALHDEKLRGHYVHNVLPSQL